jgi:hypothetical protein
LSTSTTTKRFALRLHNNNTTSNLFTMGNNDADSCVPAQVTDFIFDLSDSVTLSQLPEEQNKLYTSTFRELCTKVS